MTNTVLTHPADCAGSVGCHPPVLTHPADCAGSVGCHPPALLAYKQLPSEVLEPLMQLLNWLLWFVLLICLAWMIFSAGRLWIAFRSDMAVNDATHGVLMSLIGATVASTASGIALAFLPT